MATREWKLICQPAQLSAWWGLSTQTAETCRSEIASIYQPNASHTSVKVRNICRLVFKIEITSQHRTDKSCRSGGLNIEGTVLKLDNYSYLISLKTVDSVLLSVHKEGDCKKYLQFSC